MDSLNQFFTLYMWFPLTALLGFVYLIARFFERSYNERTYARLFVIPIICFGAAFVRYASIDVPIGDSFGDVVLGLGGVVLVPLLFNLFWLMMRKKS
jgi:hypothetical protein